MWFKLFLFVTYFAVAYSYFTVNIYDEGEAEDKVTETLRDCNDELCNELCRSFGLKWGICVAGECKCSNNLRKNDNLISVAADVHESVDEVSRACNVNACHKKCRRNGYYTGFCSKGECKCLQRSNDVLEPEDNVVSFSAYAPDLNADVDINDVEVDEVALRACNNNACNQRCRSIGFKGGICVNGKCKCDLLLLRNNVDEEVLRACNNNACNQRCKSIGFKGGICANGKCKCDLLRNKDEPQPEKNIIPLSAGASEQNAELNTAVETNEVKDAEPVADIRQACNPFQCQAICKGAGYTGGFCMVTGACVCI